MAKMKPQHNIRKEIIAMERIEKPDYKTLWGKRIWIVFLVVSLAAASLLSMCLLLSRSGEAESKQEKEDLGKLALAEAREFVPGVETAEEMTEYESPERITLALKNASGEMISVVMVDRVTGEIDAMFDFREESRTGLSAEVEVDLEKARGIAEAFLEEKI